MSRSPWSLLRMLARRPLPAADADPVPDGELLRRFDEAGDQAAFELLVWRHGGLVYGTCRRVLRDDHAAEDAFQATFLVLARKAGSVRAGGSVAAWLHRVARRVAIRAARQRRVTAPLETDPPARPIWGSDAELRAVLDAEIDRLPGRFRLPVVLCYLDGRPTEDAARVLGVPRGTVLSRLATARQRLADRLTRRGITAPAAGLTALGGGVTAEQVGACVTAAVRFAARAGGEGVAIQLANGVIQMSARKTVGVWGIVLVLAGGLATEVGVSAGGQDPVPTPASPQPPKPATAPKPAPAPVSPPQADQRREQLQQRYVILSRLQADTKALAEIKQEEIHRLQAKSPGPHVMKALSEVLTHAELAIFEAQLDVPRLENRITGLKDKLKAGDTEPIPEDQLAAAVNRNAKVIALTANLDRQREELAAIAKTVSEPEKSPRYRQVETKIVQLMADRTKALEAARAEAEPLIREALRKPIRDGLTDAESELRTKRIQLKDLEARRAELVKTLDEGTRQSAAVDSLRADLNQAREAVDRLGREMLPLQIELHGVRPSGPTAGDDKLDQILRELAELRSEVRQLREQKK